MFTPYVIYDRKIITLNDKKYYYIFRINVIILVLYEIFYNLYRKKNVMKNYYEILEVDPKASKEVIEKAYKVLAKKYHPDLQEEKNKKSAEEKIKRINEAYEILSDENKKAKYDEKLKQIKEEEERIKVAKNNEYINNIKSVYTNQYNNYKKEQELTKEANNILKKEYKKELRRLKMNAFLRKIKAIVIVLGVVFIIGCIIYIIPATNKWVRDIIENNIILKSIIDTIS